MRLIFPNLYYLCKCNVDFTKRTMSNDIKHLGIIEHIDFPHVQVRIEQSSACVGCKVARSCNAAEKKEKIIDVYSNDKELQVGQQVIVSTSTSTATYSTLLGFGLPLALLLCVLLGMKWSGATDEYAALTAIGSLIPYYIIMWILRNKIAKNITFKIENINHY